MGFGEAVKSVFSKYATFSGRARRSEYWWWALFTFLIFLPLQIIFWILWAVAFADARSVTGPDGNTVIEGFNVTPVIIGSIVLGVAWLLLLIPSLAVLSRRLHDMGQTAWWIALSFIGLSIVPVIMSFFDSQRGDNKWGPDPKAGEQGHTDGSTGGYQQQGYARDTFATPPAPPAAPTYATPAASATPPAPPASPAAPEQGPDSDGGRPPAPPVPPAPHA